MASVCETCKWWDRADTDRETGGPPDYDDVVIAHKPCRCPLIAHVSSKDWHSLPMAAAGYRDSEGYHAELRTGPQFGCIHHEAV